MGLFFQGDQRQNLVAVIKKVTERVENLRLAEVQVLRDFMDTLAALIQRDYVPDGHAQAIDYGFASTKAFDSNNVRGFSLQNIGHFFTFVDFSEPKSSSQAKTGCDTSSKKTFRPMLME
jgi:hypothetical protein